MSTVVPLVPHLAPPGWRWERMPVTGVLPIPAGLGRKCSVRVDLTNAHNPCGAVAVAVANDEYRCPQHLGEGIWLRSGLAWRWELHEEEIMQAVLTLIGGPGHGSTVLVGVQDATWTGEPGTYHRRTMRFMERNAGNPRSLSLRRYWTADVLVHESIADDTSEAYGWWQSLADVRLFEALGHEVTDDPAEVAKFHPKRAEGDD